MAARCLFLTLLATALGAAGKKDQPKLTPLEEYVQAARQAGVDNVARTTPGSLYTPGGRFADIARDLRANQPGDLVTIVVSDRASAVSRGATSSNRKTEASSGIRAAFGARKAPFPDLLGLGSESKIQGDGETSRSNTLTTTLSARVVETLPNGYLLVEGVKDITVNSERQVVTVRGVLRWNDLSPGNQVRSDRIAQMEVRVNGKGVVGDAVRRPFFLYRLLMGLLPL
ncbi:MAG: flagellar basal body L-ring protein FlgH [Acidobacteria bacterium]|nr:flagellar basal body L-ring protein FlgH [Acidobacteriota bacterium]